MAEPTKLFANNTIQIADAGGEKATVTNGRLDTNIDSSLLSTAANQVTQINQITDVTHTNTHTGNDELRVFQENHICTGNTTTTVLGPNETFTGQWQDCLNYQEVNVSIVASHNSATNGLVFQWSADGTTIGDTDTFSYYAASGGTNYTPNPAFRYVRVVYTNGATLQTSFSLQTILRRSMTGGSFHRIDTTLKDDSDARLTITVPKLKTAANTYVSQTATTAGNAKMSLEEVDDAVGGLLGLVPAAYDYIALSYTGDNLTGVVFKSGGSGGTTVATLTLAYTGSVLDSVTKT